MRAQADRATGLKPVSKVRISAEFQGPIYDQPLFEQNDRFAFKNTKQYSKYGSLLTVFPHIVSALEYCPSLNTFRPFMYCDLWPYVL